MGLRSLPIWLALAWAAPAPDAVNAAATGVVQLRVDAVPVAPELMSMCRRVGIACPGHGGPRTQTGAAFPVTGGLLTNAHVVDGALKVQVVEGDAVTTVEVADVRVDADRDLAFLPFAGLTTMAWHAAEPAVGTRAWAVGYPDDGPRTVLATTIHGTTEWTFGGRAPRALLRIRGPVHPGDSGGPLLATDGAVAGVVVAGSTEDSELKGDGLVIPAGVAQTAAGALAKTWDTHRRVGIVVAPSASDAVGVTVLAVTPGSAADGAGIRALDLIERVDGDVASPALLARRTTLGAPQVWSVRRDGKLREVHVAGAVPATPPALHTAAPLTVGPDGIYSLSLP